MMDDLLRYDGAQRRDPQVDAWFFDTSGAHRLMVRDWFERLRACGPDVRELVHDGCPVACVGDAAFGYVNAFKAHANVGFYFGAMLPDPAGLLEGDGKRMRHVKLRPGTAINTAALDDLIAAAYADIRRRTRSDTTMKKTTPVKTPAKALKKPAKLLVKDGGKSAATVAKETQSPSKLIDARIKELGDWRGELLSRIRKLIHEADPQVVEEWKWRGVPIWEHAGIICTGESYKDYIKTTFAHGAALPDPGKLFNAGLDGGTRRAIDFRSGDEFDEKAFKALIRAAVALNTAKKKPKGA
jgi:hypothetical protein